MNLFKLLDLNYLFDPAPGDFKFMIPMIIIFLMVIIGSSMLGDWIKKHPQRKSIEKLIPRIHIKLRDLGVMGFFLLWIRYENIAYLSMRFFLLVYLAYLLWTLGNAIYMYKKVLPEVVKETEKTARHRKYLSKRKRA